jgi:ABC-type multidrug transport system fused ATPase/permease subunit
MDRFKHTIVSKLIEYVAIIVGILVDVWNGARRNAVWFIVLALTHVGLEFASLYVLYALARSAADLLAQTATAEQSAMVYEMLALLLVVLVASAAANYGAVRNVIAAARNVEMVCVRRGLDLLSRLPQYGSAYANHIVGMKRFLRVVTTDARYCGMAARLTLLAFPAIVLALGSLGILFYISPWLTVLLLALSAVMSLSQYPIHLKTAAASREMERTRSGFMKSLARAIARKDHTGSPAPTENTNDGEEELSDTNVRSFYQRLVYIELSSISAQISSVVILCVAILVLLLQTSFGAMSVAILLLYVATARQALSNITKLLRSLATVSRLFPQISRYFRFMWSATQRWPLLVSQVEVRDASHKESRQTDKEHTLPADAAPLEPGLTYRVLARQASNRSVAAAVIDALGLSAEAVGRYAPHFCLTPKDAAEGKAGAGTKPIWEILVLPFDAPSVGSATEENREQVSTTILISSYQARRKALDTADVFIVLNPENQVVLQTRDAAAARARVEEELGPQAARGQADNAALEMEEEM